MEDRFTPYTAEDISERIGHYMAVNPDEYTILEHRLLITILRLEESLYVSEQARTGHVHMIADLAAERDNLESQLAALRLTLADACTQRDKYMRRTAEWRDAALNGTAFTVACTGCNDECSACREEG